MKTILVPLDFSPISEKTAAAALALVQDIHVNVVFLHVRNVVAPAESKESEVADAYAEARMRGIVRKARDQGIIANARVSRGAAVDQILKEAKATGADLIVMGSHHYDAINGATVGETFKQVLKNAHCPLVLVPYDSGNEPRRGSLRETESAAI